MGERLYNLFILGIVFFLLFIIFAENLVRGSGYKPPANYLGMDDDNNHTTRTVTTNTDFISSLYQEINLSDDKEVFRYVFSQLDEEVIIYPTENYFYFKFINSGKTFGGAFAFFPEDRDKGKLGFGYIERNDDPNVIEHFLDSNRVGGGAEYTERDGVYLKKINNETYAVTYGKKKVIFKLYNVTMNPPQKAKLHPEEVFVGPIFDESGLKFFLVYNKEVQHLYHILNEDGYVPETFISLNEDIFLGKRTQFAFYNDREYHRKILIGAKGENVMKNNWYDGPFDQMPDNYILWGHIPYYMQYIEAAYPSAKGRIDEFGNYLDNPGTRVAVGPYYVYFSLDDLHFVRKCTQQNLSASKFYFCITQQVYNIPATINYFDRLAIP